MAKSKYVQERDFEKKSTIRWRGRWWLQIPTFLLFVAGGVVAAIVVGTIGKVIYYGATSGIWNWMTQLWGVQTFPPYDANYFQFLIVQSLSGQDLFENNSWVLSIAMLIAFLIPTIYGAQKWWSWTQLYSDRTLNFNRFANLKEIDRTYELVPDRNKFYTGETGPQMSHISGYSLAFARMHPILWIKQILKAPLGLNREVFPFWYRPLRPHLIKIFPKVYEHQLSVKGGFKGFYYIDNKPTHMEVLGVTRAGKDQRMGYPSIDILRRTDPKHQPNIVDTDAKNEDAKMSYRPLREAGYDVHLVNIQDTDWSESWNPLEVALNYAEDGEWVKATDEAMVVVQILGKDTAGDGGDSVWDNVAEDLQMAIILVLLWLAVEHNDSSIVSPNNMLQFVNDLSEFDDPENENEDGLTRYFKNLAKLEPRPLVVNEALNRAASFLSAKSTTKSSAIFSFQQRSRMFANETVALLTSHSTIRLSDYGFSRLFKLKMSTAEYAGLTTTVKLIDRSKDKVVEKDTLKVSRAGVIQYPFKSVFPESWAIEVSFENKNNPVHFRKDTVSITGLKRHAKNIKGEYKYDKYSKRPIINVITERKKTKMRPGVSVDYELRYSENPVAVFLITPQSNDNYAAIASLFLGQVFSINTAIASELNRRKMDRQIIYKLNEFSMFPEIPGFANFLTRGLTYGHIVHVYLQDHAQLLKQYASHVAKEIQHQMLTSVYILSSDEDDNEALSKSLGDIEIQKETANFQSGNDRQNKGNIQAGVEKRPLMSAKEIGELMDGEIIITRRARRHDKRFKKVRALPIFSSEETELPNARDLIGKSFNLDYATTDLNLKIKNKKVKGADDFKKFVPYYYELEQQIGIGTEVPVTDPFAMGMVDNGVAALDELRDMIDMEQTLSPTEVNESTAFMTWQDDFMENLDEPFLTVSEFNNYDLVWVLEELLAGLLTKIYYAHRTDEQTNALQQAKRRDLFATRPQMNNRRILLRLLNNDAKTFWELEKRKRAYLLGEPLEPTETHDNEEEEHE